jgi:hypothetical protein
MEFWKFFWPVVIVATVAIFSVSAYARGETHSLTDLWCIVNVSDAYPRTVPSGDVAGHVQKGQTV